MFPYGLLGLVTGSILAFAATLANPAHWPMSMQHRHPEKDKLQNQIEILAFESLAHQGVGAFFHLQRVHNARCTALCNSFPSPALRQIDVEYPELSIGHQLIEKYPK